MTEEIANPPVQLPPCPEGFKCRRNGGAFYEKPRLPKSCKFVASMEFDLSPAASSTEVYYVRFSRKRPGWELWSDGYDDENHLREIYAIGPAMQIPPKVAAIHLLAAAWKDTYNSEPWYIVLREGLVSDAEIQAIFEMLFPMPADATAAEPGEPETPTTEETST